MVLKQSLFIYEVIISYNKASGPRLCNTILSAILLDQFQEKTFNNY